MPRKGYKFTPEQRARLSAAHMGLKYPNRKPHSFATKAKIAATLAAMPFNPKAIDAMAISRIGCTWTQGEKGGTAKLTEAQVREIFRRAWKGESQKFLAEIFGVNPATISHIKRGDCWRHLKLKRPIN